MQQQNHVELTAAGVVFSDSLLVGFVRRWGGDETVMRAMQATLQAFCASVEGPSPLGCCTSRQDRDCDGGPPVGGAGI